MTTTLTLKLRVFVAALWWGSLTTLGFFVVPMLFSNLATPAMAGNMAAKLFAAQTWVSVGCAMLLLLLLRFGKQSKIAVAGVSYAYDAIIFVVFGMLLALLVTFGVSPRIVARENLMLWHAVGSAMYVLQWLCAGVLLYKLAAHNPNQA
ncbi:MAG: DUF4149 domain-containing protein [Burkholderiaceae bacterium]|nr:DUF4149 domain-containing protein [Burkholderiaceae bacterium]